MRLYTFCDSRFARLQRRFLESLCDDYEVICHEFSNFTSAAGNAWFGGRDVWREKTDLILQAIRDNWGQAIVVSDIDVQFFAPTRPLVEHQLSLHDIVFQEDPEGGATDINIGFMAMHCQAGVEELWHRVQQRIKEQELHDQFAVAQLLGCTRQSRSQPEIELNYGIFPRRVWAHGGSARWNISMPSDLCVHHSTWAHGEAAKLRQMARIRRRYLHPWTFQLEKPWMLAWDWLRQSLGRLRP